MPPRSETPTALAELVKRTCDHALAPERPDRPELRSALWSARLACKFSLRPCGVDYVDVIVSNNQAEVCCQYLTKGRRVAVEARLPRSEWQAEDGSRRQKPEAVVRSVEFLDSPRLTAVRPSWRHLSRVCSS